MRVYNVYTERPSIRFKLLMVGRLRCIHFKQRTQFPAQFLKANQGQGSGSQ